MIEKHPPTRKLYLNKDDHLKWDGKWYYVPKSMHGTAKNLVPYCILAPDYIPQGSTVDFLLYVFCCLALTFSFLYFLSWVLYP